MSDLQNSRGIDIVIGKVLKWFREHQNWLIIYDNADYLDSLYTKSKMKCTPDKETLGHVLLTTRAGKISFSTKFLIVRFLILLYNFLICFFLK